MPQGRAARPSDERLGARIRELRREHGVTQEALAEALGLTFQQVQKYESGANRVSATRLIDIADTLQVPLKRFFPANDAEGDEAGELHDKIRRLSVEHQALVDQLVDGLLKPAA